MVRAVVQAVHRLLSVQIRDFGLSGQLLNVVFFHRGEQTIFMVLRTRFETLCSGLVYGEGKAQSHLADTHTAPLGLFAVLDEG